MKTLLQFLGTSTYIIIIQVLNSALFESVLARFNSIERILTRLFGSPINHSLLTAN